jgi:hypothetical protein
VALSHLDAPGANTLKLGGQFDLGPGFPGLASATDGVRIAIEDLGRGGALVLLLDVGPGAQPSVCGSGEGWRSSAGQLRSVFRTRIGAVTSASGSACLGPGSNKGIVRVKTTQTEQTIKFKVVGRRGSYTAIGPLRAHFILGAGDSSTAAAQGYCGDVTFVAGPSASPSCVASLHNGALARISCQ